MSDHRRQFEATVKSSSTNVLRNIRDSICLDLDLEYLCDEQQQAGRVDLSVVNAELARRSLRRQELTIGKPTNAEHLRPGDIWMLNGKRVRFIHSTLVAGVILRIRVDDEEGRSFTTDYYKTNVVYVLEG